MIKLDGKYDLGGLDRLDCEVKIEKGYIIPYANNKYLEISKDKKLIKIRPRSTQKEPAPIGHNYILEYIGEDEKEHRIFVKLNQVQKFIINNQLKEKPLNLKLIVWGIIVFIVVSVAGFVLNDIYNSVKSQISPINQPSNNEDRTNHGLDKQSIATEKPTAKKSNTDSLTPNNTFLDKNDTTINF